MKVSRKKRTLKKPRKVASKQKVVALSVEHAEEINNLRIALAKELAENLGLCDRLDALEHPLDEITKETGRWEWDMDANGGQGGEVYRTSYGVIKNDKFYFSDDMPTFQEPEPPFIDLSMSRAECELTLAFILVVFWVGMFQGLITARGL